MRACSFSAHEAACPAPGPSAATSRRQKRNASATILRPSGRPDAGCPLASRSELASDSQSAMCDAQYARFSAASPGRPERQFARRAAFSSSRLRSSSSPSSSHQSPPPRAAIRRSERPTCKPPSSQAVDLRRARRPNAIATSWESRARIPECRRNPAFGFHAADRLERCRSGGKWSAGVTWPPVARMMRAQWAPEQSRPSVTTRPTTEQGIRAFAANPR